MKKLIFLFLIGFTFTSCVKKEEEEVVPYTCQDCIEMYEVEIMNYNNDTILSSRIDTAKFRYCGTYEYQNHISSSLSPIIVYDSLGYGYVKGWTRKLLFYWHCDFVKGYEILTFE
jgi:hypothetical protein